MRSTRSPEVGRFHIQLHSADMLSDGKQTCWMWFCNCHVIKHTVHLQLYESTDSTSRATCVHLLWRKKHFRSVRMNQVVYLVFLSLLCHTHTAQIFVSVCILWQRAVKSSEPPSSTDSRLYKGYHIKYIEWSRSSCCTWTESCRCAWSRCKQ